MTRIGLGLLAALLVVGCESSTPPIPPTGPTIVRPTTPATPQPSVDCGTVEMVDWWHRWNQPVMSSYIEYDFRFAATRRHTQCNWHIAVRVVLTQNGQVTRAGQNNRLGGEYSPFDRWVCGGQEGCSSATSFVRSRGYRIEWAWKACLRPPRVYDYEDCWPDWPA